MLCSTKIIIKKNPKLCQTHFTKSITLFARFYAIAIGGPEIGRLRHCSDYHTYSTLRPIKTFYPLSRSFSPIQFLQNRTYLLGVVQFSTFGLLTPSSATSPSIRIRRFRRPDSTITAVTNHAQQKNASTTTEPVSQSGHRYIIQRVLQEKGNPPLRVCLAMYVLLKFDD